jgi:serine/threonine-protein kinase
MEEKGGLFFRPRLSPDGKRLAVGEFTEEPQIWVYDLERGTRTLLATLPVSDAIWQPVWTPDGNRIAFWAGNLFWKAADGSGETQLLLSGEHPQTPSSWKPDGRVLAFYETHPTTQSDIWMWHRDGDGKSTPFLVSEFDEHSPMFSPDGRWLAYVSDESGHEEVYVRPYSGPVKKYTISTDGGREPVWSADGRELFYRNGNQMMAVPVKTGSEFSAGAPRVLFGGGHDSMSRGGSSYDVSPDGQRFLMIKTEPGSAPTQVHIVLNWLAELKRLVPAN